MDIEAVKREFETRTTREPRALIASLIAEVQRLRAISCRGEDPTCPCRDGDECHYRGENPMQTLLEREFERLRKSLQSCIHALRSYQHGNASAELAEEVANHAEGVLK